MERTTIRRDRQTGTTTWTRNAKGNLVAKLGSTWATVYREKLRYRYVRNHVFSRAIFDSEAEACRAAERS